jgi:hypothetical protein
MCQSGHLFVLRKSSALGFKQSSSDTTRLVLNQESDAAALIAVFAATRVDPPPPPMKSLAPDATANCRCRA